MKPEEDPGDQSSDDLSSLSRGLLLTAAWEVLERGGCKFNSIRGKRREGSCSSPAKACTCTQGSIPLIMFFISSTHDPGFYDPV
ncbi:hypothetical protein MLD38_004664 [Melastoma candidum]|uniref:Uncharacterized protein n=1 Tax=Melastoma candidum TaxID=119954 RepID=A0ACB9S6I4_9MYRT|nr:hypothetical protein MLD38_004664 [Melastoma candidum]